MTARITLSEAVATLSGGAREYMQAVQDAGAGLGRFGTATWRSEPSGFAAAFKGEKEGSCTISEGPVRLGVDYLKLAQNRDRDVIGPLPGAGSEWVAFPYIYSRPGKDGETLQYARLYILRIHLPRVTKRFFLQGVEVDASEYKSRQTESARNPKPRKDDGTPLPDTLTFAPFLHNVLSVNNVRIDA